MTEKKARSMAGLPWIAAMAFFMQALDATILNTALPAIAQSLDRSPLAMQSAIISYTLTVAMLIPASGWLADRFGTRRVFMLAVTLFTLGSLACALDVARGAGMLSRDSGDRRRNDDAGCTSGTATRLSTQ
jgi:MFS family permease